MFDRCHDFFPRLRRHGMYLGTESFTRQVGATPWFSRQGQAHIVSTAIRSPVPARGPAEVGGKPLFRPWFSIDPQPASISPRVNISIVFIVLPFDCGGIIHHPAIKNDSSAISQPTKRRRIGNQIDVAFIFMRADFVNVHVIFPEASRQPIAAAAKSATTR